MAGRQQYLKWNLIILGIWLQINDSIKSRFESASIFFFLSTFIEVQSSLCLFNYLPNNNCSKASQGGITTCYVGAKRKIGKVRKNSVSRLDNFRSQFLENNSVLALSSSRTTCLICLEGIKGKIISIRFKYIVPLSNLLLIV